MRIGGGGTFKFELGSEEINQHVNQVCLGLDLLRQTACQDIQYKIVLVGAGLLQLSTHQPFQWSLLRLDRYNYYYLE